MVTLGEGPEEVVIGAHYYVVRLADGSLSQGAVDNAASSVMLIRLAEALRTETLPVRLRVVWFDMEELGLIGSAQYVKQHSADRIGAMLNFDINVYGNTIVFGPSELKENAGAAPQVRRDLRRGGHRVRGVCPDASRRRPVLRQSRHSHDLGRDHPGRGGPPAVADDACGQNSGLAQGTLPSIMRTIHTPEDTPAKLSEETMLRMQRFALSLVRSVARR